MNNRSYKLSIHVVTVIFLSITVFHNAFCHNCIHLTLPDGSKNEVIHRSRKNAVEIWIKPSKTFKSVSAQIFVKKTIEFKDTVAYPKLLKIKAKDLFDLKNVRETGGWINIYFEVIRKVLILSPDYFHVLAHIKRYEFELVTDIWWRTSNVKGMQIIINGGAEVAIRCPPNETTKGVHTLQTLPQNSTDSKFPQPRYETTPYSLHISQNNTQEDEIIDSMASFIAYALYALLVLLLILIIIGVVLVIRQWENRNRNSSSLTSKPSERRIRPEENHYEEPSSFIPSGFNCFSVESPEKTLPSSKPDYKDNSKYQNSGEDGGKCPESEKHWYENKPFNEYDVPKINRTAYQSTDISHVPPRLEDTSHYIEMNKFNFDI